MCWLPACFLIPSKGSGNNTYSGYDLLGFSVHPAPHHTLFHFGVCALTFSQVCNLSLNWDSEIFDSKACICILDSVSEPTFDLIGKHLETSHFFPELWHLLLCPGPPRILLRFCTNLWTRDAFFPSLFFFWRMVIWITTLFKLIIYQGLR